MVSTGSTDGGGSATDGADGRTDDGLDLDGLADRLDERLEDADERLARRYPGDRPGRQPVHTVYVPADRYAAGLCHRWANGAERALIEHGALFLEVIGGDEVLLNRVLLKLEREPVEDLRIDVEDGYGDRGDEAEDADVRAAAAALREDVDAGRRAAVRRAAVQEPRGPDPPSRDAQPRPVPAGAHRRRAAAAGLRAHPAQGHLGRPGQGDGRRRRPPRAASRPPGGGAALRDPGRDAAGGAGAQGRLAAARDAARGGRALRRAALRHLRLQRRPRHRRGAAEHGAPGRRPRQGGDAGGRRRHRRPGLRRLDQRAAGRRRGRRAPGVGAAPPAGHPLARARLLPGLGPAPRAAPDAVRRDLRLLPRRLRRRDHPPAGVRRAAGRVGRRRARDREGAGGLPAARVRVRRADLGRGDRPERPRPDHAGRARRAG